MLTGVAVVALPAGEADSLARGAAAVVTEVVVPRPAQVLATLAVIVRHARNPVLVHHLRVCASVLVLGPHRPDVQPFLGSYSGNENFF